MRRFTCHEPWGNTSALHSNAEFWSGAGQPCLMVQSEADNINLDSDFVSSVSSASRTCEKSSKTKSTKPVDHRTSSPHGNWGQSPAEIGLPPV
jgi:hypothetical protein